LMHVIAAKALAFKVALGDEFKTYQMNTVENAKILAVRLMESGINLVSDGTDNHMILADLRNLGITGKAAQEVLGRAGITVNKNTIPFDTETPSITSGIRIGTPAVTTRGMTTSEMRIIARLIVDVLKNPSNETVIKKAEKEVRNLCKTFPIYEDSYWDMN
ncbi:serine hydroxymethyltransferase, partial [Desulfococcaceae bacterium HSG8]|nr:serine hydroxymethyltransferase [Desulfococcaceae bacterium HSG8]